MKNTFVISDEVIHGVILASDNAELAAKINTLLESIREPISEIELPDFEDLNDMETHEFTVAYDSEFGCDDEEFFITRVNPI